MENFQINFTANEVNNRAMFFNNVAAWVKKNKPPAGKERYTYLLCDKAKAVVPAHSNFSGHETFKPVPRGRVRGYLICQHGETAAVVYAAADFARDRGLVFELQVKCERCLLAPAVAPPAAPPVEEIQIAEFPVVVAPETPAFDRARASVLAALDRAREMVVENGDELRGIDENRNIIGAMIMEAWNLGIDGVPQIVRRSPTPPLRRSPTPPLRRSPTPARSRSPVDRPSANTRAQNAFDVLNRAQQKKQAQKNAKAAKKGGK